MSSKQASEVTFREVQRPTQWWIWGTVLLLAGLAVWAFIQQILLDRPFGSQPAPDALVVIMLVVLALGLPALLLSFHLRVEVSREAIHLRIFPLWSRTIPLSELREFHQCDYHPLLEYGGWGLRWSPWRGWAYSIRGNRGVQLTLARGRPVLIGTRRPDELVAAIDAAVSR